MSTDAWSIEISVRPCCQSLNDRTGWISRLNTPLDRTTTTTIVLTKKLGEPPGLTVVLHGNADGV